MKLRVDLDVSSRDSQATLEDIRMAVAEHELVILRTCAGEHMATITALERLPEEIQDALPQL